MTDKYNVSKTPSNIRLATIYDDPEFIEDSLAYKNDIAEHLLEKGLINAPNQFFTGSRKIIEALGKPWLDRLDALLEQYAITDDEFWSPLDLNQAPVFDTPIEIDLSEGDHVNLRVYPWAKQDDFKEAWPAIEQALQTRKGYVQKLRGTANSKLLYAVMQARTKGVPWREVAEKINTNTLSGYVRERGDKKTWTEAGLKDHYQKNKQYVVK